MLSINIWDLLWTVVNFFLLYFLLKKLLYGPVLSFLDQRRARIEAGQEAERQVREALARNDAQLQELAEQSRQEAAELLRQARAKDGGDRAAWNEELKREGQRLRQETVRNARQRQEMDGERLEAQEAELTRILADRLLHVSGQRSA